MFGRPAKGQLAAPAGSKTRLAAGHPQAFILLVNIKTITQHTLRIMADDTVMDEVERFYDETKRRESTRFPNNTPLAVTFLKNRTRRCVRDSGRSCTKHPISSSLNSRQLAGVTSSTKPPG
ncbi:hypothetical protein CGCVW01_v010702 [Colletotrichum viniferum]|nr:hypothetical protein CGCVW01_v010702 [Colletotrichum viniferum]